jgi:hypothetical protein
VAACGLDRLARSNTTGESTIMPIYDGEIDKSGLTAVTVAPTMYGRMSPCRQCPSWFVTVDRYDQQMVIREWHDKTCPTVTDNSAD